MPNPNNNQKKISEDEREKISEGTRKKREKLAETKEAIEQAEIEIFEREKANLPSLLESRLQVIETALVKELEDYQGLKSALIHEVIASSHKNTYKAKELEIVIEAYKKMITMINKNQLYVPTLASFCSFAGFSTITFEHSYLQSPDEDKRNTAQMIKDYVSDMTLDAGKMRRTDASVTIHESKAILKNVEAQAPQIIQYTQNVDPNAILEKVNQIRQGVIDAEYKEKEKK